MTEQPLLPIYTRQLPHPDKVGKALERRAKVHSTRRYMRTVLMRVSGFGGLFYIRCGGEYTADKLSAAVRQYGGQLHFDRVRSLGVLPKTGEEVCERV